MRWGVGMWRDYMQLDGEEWVLLSVHFNYPQSVEDWPYYTGMPTIHLQKTFEDHKLKDFKILNNPIQSETLT